MGRRFLGVFGAAAAAALYASPQALATTGGTLPARGAPLTDVAAGTIAATLVTAAVVWTSIAHRSGRIRWLGRLAGFSERVSGLPGWAALPAAVTGGSLVIAVFGYYWDVAKHIDTGRDPGPFGTAAHYPILIGLFGITLGGFLAVTLGCGDGVPTSVRLARGWRAPLGGLLIFLCGACALSGFPLDDVWHALFGQDVTLWGPTHVLMVGGASLATLAIWVLLVEGQRARRSPTESEPLLLRLRGPSIAGGFLLGLSALQGEFDFGVPQFQLVYQPILIMLAASLGLVVARIRLGRLGALQAVAFYLVVRGLLTLAIGPALGEATLHFPLYLVEAALVTAVPEMPPIRLGAAAGVLVGTIGLAAEWGWSHLWMPLPWPAALLPQAAVLGFVAALAGGVLGGLIGRALTDPGARGAPRALVAAAVAAAVACIAYPLPMTGGTRTSATVALHDVHGAPKRTVDATVTLSPRRAARDAQWLTITAWQGGGLRVDRLRRVAEGVYRTTEPIPVYGNWKSVLRLENGRAVRAVPLYMPADPAIPAPAVSAPERFTRTFVRDKRILQREAVGGAGLLALPAYLLLLAIATGWLAAIGRGLSRLRARVPARAGVTA
jgi:hypothetical protein